MDEPIQSRYHSVTLYIRHSLHCIQILQHSLICELIVIFYFFPFSLFPPLTFHFPFSSFFPAFFPPPPSSSIPHFLCFLSFYLSSSFTLSRYTLFHLLFLSSHFQYFNICFIIFPERKRQNSEVSSLISALDSTLKLDDRSADRVSPEIEDNDQDTDEILRPAGMCANHLNRLLRCGNTSNKIVQLVAQHCCIASCRANVARNTTQRATNFLCCRE